MSSEEESILQHIEELVERLRKSLLFWLAATFIVAFFPVNWITCPLFGLYCVAKGNGPLQVLINMLGYVPGLVALVNMISLYTKITSMIMGMKISLMVCSPENLLNVYVLTVFWAGLAISLPYIIYQIYMYIKPALYPHELRLVKRIIWASIGLFLIGELFAFTIVIPFGLKLLVVFGQLAGAVNQYCISEVLSFVVLTALTTGIAFLFPVVVYLLVYFGVLDPAKLRGKNLRLAFIVIMFIAAIITPGTTGVSMIIVGIPMFLMYYLAIIFGEKALKEREMREATQSSLQTQ